MYSFQRRLDDVESLLASFPNLGSVFTIDEYHSYRRFHLDPYTIYYRVEEGTLLHLRIVRQERDVKKVKD